MVKYRASYFDMTNNGWRVDISNLSYSGDIVTLNTAQGQGCTISYTGSDDPFEPIIYSTAKFTIVKHDLGLINVSELKNSNDKDWSVDVYKNDILFWTGFLVPDGIQEFYQSLPYDVELTATDGLKLLQGCTYSTGNFPLPVGVVQRSFISHARDIFYSSSNLGKIIPIRWIGTLSQYDPVSPKDAYTQTIYSPNGEGYTDANGNKYSSYYILENWLRAYQSRLYQRGGKWIIERIPDVSSGTYVWTEMSAVYDGVTLPVETTGVETKIKEIGTDYQVDDGAYTINLPGVRKVTATYDSANSENILPNGSFDNSLSQPRQWWPSNAVLVSTLVDSINGRDGNSMELAFAANAAGSSQRESLAMRTGVAGTENKLPIDTVTLYKRLSLGFTIMPQNGFPYNSTTGIIQWASSAPLKIRVELSASGTTSRIFTLTENGFWIPKPTGGNFTMTNATNAAFFGSTAKMSAIYGGNVIVGDWISYKYQGAEIIRAYVPTEFSNNTHSFLTYAGQWMIDNSAGEVIAFSVVFSTASSWVLELTTLKHSSTATDYIMSFGMSNTDRDGAIVVIPEDSKINDVITINFDKFQGVKLPDFSDDPGHKYAAINWFFYVNRGQKYTLDDIYMTVDDNSEVYQYEYESSKFTDTEDYTLKISSSTNGFYISNIMTSFKNSYVEKTYFDVTGYMGTLTDLTARTIARYRSKSLEMFEGTILGSDIDFGAIYTVVGITGKKLLPLSLSYNTELCQADVSAVELNLGDTSFTRKFYGANDKPLSNQIIN